MRRMASVLPGNGVNCLRQKHGNLHRSTDWEDSSPGSCDMESWKTHTQESTSINLSASGNVAHITTEELELLSVTHSVSYLTFIPCLVHAFMYLLYGLLVLAFLFVYSISLWTFCVRCFSFYGLYSHLLRLIVLFGLPTTRL